MSRVIIEEECDGFRIIVSDGLSRKSWHFDQEDSISAITEVFEELGFESEYEEVY